MSCENHKKDLFGEADLRKAAKAIADMNYESLTTMLSHLGEIIEWDARNDFAGGRKMLSEKLLIVSKLINTSSIFMKDAFEISSRFMQNKDKEVQECDARDAK